MNTALTTVRRQHPPDTRATARTRRLGLLDRVALSLGVALIRWGRRPGREPARHRRLARRPESGPQRREREAARAELERAKARGAANLLGRIR